MKKEIISDIPNYSKYANIFGKLTLISIPTSFVLGFIIKNIGINSLLQTFSIPFAIITIYYSLKEIKRCQQKDSIDLKNAQKNLKIGIFSLAFILIFIIIIAIFLFTAFYGK